MTDVRKTEDAGVKAMETIALPRWWVEQACEQLFSMKQLPSGQLGDWAFLFREMLKDILARPRSAPVPQCDAEPVAWRIVRGGADGTYTGLYERLGEAEVWLNAWKRDYPHNPELQPLYAAPAGCDAGSARAALVEISKATGRTATSLRAMAADALSHLPVTDEAGRETVTTEARLAQAIELLKAVFDPAADDGALFNAAKEFIAGNALSEQKQ